MRKSSCLCDKYLTVIISIAFREPSMFSYLELEPQLTTPERAANIQKILEAIEDFFLQTNLGWSEPKVEDKLELAVRETIGIALKSRSAAVYIEQLMGLD